MPDRNFRVLLLCPTGQDAHLIAGFLKQESMDASPTASIEDLCAQDKQNAGVLIIAEEALKGNKLELLNASLSLQEPWSDIPIILLLSATSRRGHTRTSPLEHFVSSFNVTLLERPLSPLTLLSATKVALRARLRQYQVRDLLISQSEATKMRDEFISIASHELKTPLTSLKLQTQMAKRRLGLGKSISVDAIAKQLDDTIGQIDRLNKLVDDMLDISRITTGKLSLKKDEVDLTKLITELVNRFSPQFEEAGIEVVHRVEPEIIGHWDAYKVEQVMNNLFSNAIRYSPDCHLYVGLKKMASRIEITVEDTGTGIKKENLERIFERFERANSRVSGLGLGLYISRQIIELHGGTIGVESEIGQGTKFTIELPN